MDTIDADGYRANVGIVLCNDAGAVLLAGRKGQSGWQFPQGGIQVDESVEEAMYRELEEEVGLGRANVEMLGSTECWLHYQLPDRYVRRDVHPVCIGQKQRWFLLRLTCEDERVRLDSTDTPEFDRWRWVEFWHPVREVIYFKRNVYVQALRELGPILFPKGIPPQPEWWLKEWDQIHPE
jgi:putative (di)nucleoside polyphosphate hydrolase